MTKLEIDMYFAYITAAADCSRFSWILFHMYWKITSSHIFYYAFWQEDKNPWKS